VLHGQRPWYQPAYPEGIAANLVRRAHHECLKLDILNGSDSIVASCIDTHRTVQLREVKGANSRGDYLSLGVSCIPLEPQGDGRALAVMVFGAERLMELVKKHSAEPVEQFLSEILKSHTLYTRGCPLRDDFTLLCVQIGSAGEAGSDSGFAPDDKPNALSLSSCDAIEKICAIILREIDSRGYSEESIWAAKLCIHEALMNALIHGNKNNRAKKVSVFYKVTDDKFSVSVIDEGDGFDHRNLPDPKTCQNLLKDGGRGLFFIRQYMDEVTFNEKGNRIMLVKYLTPRGK